MSNSRVTAQRSSSLHGGPQRSSGSAFDIFDFEDSSIPPKNIHEAAERGLTGYIVRIIERNIEFDINQKDKYLRTALHWAAEMGHVEAAEALIDYGCDVKSTECNGRAALHLAAKNGNVEMLRVLLEDRSKEEIETMVNATDYFGITPVFLSMIRGEESRAAFELLIEYGARYNSVVAVQEHPGLKDPALDRNAKPTVAKGGTKPPDYESD